MEGTIRVSKSTLALLGGKPVIDYEITAANPIGPEEISAVTKVASTGILSAYIGDEGSNFLGGEKVREFEESFKSTFGFKHAVSVNSWTSGLWTIIGALGLEPGDEVITSSWTMAATATTLLHWNVVPVFADIDPRTFNLNPKDVEAKVTSRTRAIVAPDIFGQSADVSALRNLCTKYGLRLISDSAQSPMAEHQGKIVSSASDIGGFSFNYHKHVHTGEGGMVVTDNAELAERVQLLRNHGEVIIGRRESRLSQYGIMGMNLRLGEIESAIGVEQLKKLPNLVETKRYLANRLSESIQGLTGLNIPHIDPRNTHVFYIYGMTIDHNNIGVPRKLIIQALKSEGVPAILSGYQNIHKLPLFRRELTYKHSQIPYSLLSDKRRSELRETRLPVSENLHDNSFIGINWCSKAFSDQDVDNVAQAFHKVWENLDKLRMLPNLE